MIEVGDVFSEEIRNPKSGRAKFSSKKYFLENEFEREEAFTLGQFRK